MLYQKLVSCRVELLRSEVKLSAWMRTSSRQLEAFGRTLRRARRDRDLSQEALADAAGLGAKHVSEIERANRDPRLTTILKLAAALDLRAGELIALYDEQIEAARERS